MISEKIVRMIEQQAHRLTQQWLAKVQSDARLVSMRKLDPSLLYERCFAVFSHLQSWLDYQTSKEKLIEYYTALGRERFREGIPISEEIHALILARRVLYVFMNDSGLLDQNAFSMLQGIELSNRVIVFFDRAMYYTAYGYEEEMRSVLQPPCDQPCPPMEQARSAVEHVTADPDPGERPESTDPKGTDPKGDPKGTVLRS